MTEYKVCHPNKTIVAGRLGLGTALLADAAFEANRYLQRVDGIFKEKKINFFEALGVTNISATVGEIYARFLCRQYPGVLVSNPHPDGRPDILCLATPEIEAYYAGCFDLVDKAAVPQKSKLTPFMYGGLEIKCTIGISSAGGRRHLAKKPGKAAFPIGMQRVTALSDINWVAHHAQNIDLLGLYYDYIPQCGGAPQIVAGFFDSLDTASWNAVSHGDALKKTTSMTSIKGQAKDRLKKSCVFIIDSRLYRNALEKIGVEMRG